MHVWKQASGEHYLVGIIAFMAFNAAYLVWCERKRRGHIQRRIGSQPRWAGLRSAAAAGRRHQADDQAAARAPGVDGILFRVAPMLVMIPAITSMVTIPSPKTWAPGPVNSVLLLSSPSPPGMIAVSRRLGFAATSMRSSPRPVLSRRTWPTRSPCSWWRSQWS
jgi:NADH:ubiquinone oxidoreductase subunit H